MALSWAGLVPTEYEGRISTGPVPVDAAKKNRPVLELSVRGGEVPGDVSRRVVADRLHVDEESSLPGLHHAPQRHGFDPAGSGPVEEEDLFHAGQGFHLPRLIEEKGDAAQSLAGAIQVRGDVLVLRVLRRELHEAVVRLQVVPPAEEHIRVPLLTVERGGLGVLALARFGCLLELFSGLRGKAKRVGAPRVQEAGFLRVVVR